MTETNWIPGDWATIKKGQKVRLESGNQWTEIENWSDTRSLARHAADGWTLFIEAPPQPELLTEPPTAVVWHNGVPSVYLFAEAVTAKKILDRIDQIHISGKVWSRRQVREIICAEFGVSE